MSVPNSALRAEASEWRPAKMPAVTKEQEEAAAATAAAPAPAPAVQAPRSPPPYRSPGLNPGTPPFVPGSAPAAVPHQPLEAGAGAPAAEGEATTTGASGDWHADDAQYWDPDNMPEMTPEEYEAYQQEYEQYMMYMQQQQQQQPPGKKKEKNKWFKKKGSSHKKSEGTIGAGGLEAFSLIHNVSPFMQPLRALTGSSLPHIKVDQRYGRRGAPHTAVMQFLVAPVVVNYKPVHFHHLTPGDCMEFCHDFALVLNEIKSATAISFSFGENWKQFNTPFCYVSCKKYKDEVFRLCPHEVPNSKPEAVYQDDVVKDVTELLLSVPEVAPLQAATIVETMKNRVNMLPLFTVILTLFKDLRDYQIQFRNLDTAPPTILLRTSAENIATLPQPVALGDTLLLDDLPDAPNTFPTEPQPIIAYQDDEEVPEVKTKKTAPTPAATGGDGTQRNLILAGVCVGLTALGIVSLLRKK